MKRIFFLGQAPARPSSDHEIPGTYLHNWLSSIGFSDDEIINNCHFFALTDTFPGSTKNGHLAPTKDQIEKHRPTLKQHIINLQPELVVPVGKMAITEILGDKRSSLNDIVGRQFSVNPFGVLKNEIVCIPLSHPSGRSAWNYLHKELVGDALHLLEVSARLDDR